MTSSRTSLARPLRLLVVAVLATAGMLVPAGSASAADTVTPVLSSFSVSATQVTPGQQVTFSYVATDDSGSLSRLRLAYLDRLGHSDLLIVEGPPASGSVTVTIPDNWWDGAHSLNVVTLTDASNNVISYFRNGTTFVTPGTTGPTSHTLLLAPGDLTVSGSSYEMTVPSLLSVSVASSAARPEAISVAYTAADTTGSLKSVELLFHDKYQLARIITLPGTGSLPLVDLVNFAIPATWPNGDYRLARVTLTDRFLNEARYDAAGTVRLAPLNAEGPTSHTLDFGNAAFNVSNSSADFTAPVLTSVLRSGSPMLPGGTASLSYTAESQDPLTSVSFRYTDTLGRSLNASRATDQLTGTLSATVPVDRPIGNYTLQDVYLQDSAGNGIRYYRNGTTTRTPQQSGQVPGTHALALSAMDLYVGRVPAAPMMEGVRLSSGRALVMWGSFLPDGLPVTGHTITAQPGGRTVNASGSATQGEVTGLTNGTTYRFTVRASNAVGTSQASSASAAATPRMTNNIITPGDFTGDGRNDLLGVKTSAKRNITYRPTFLYRGNGLGGFIASTPVAHPYGYQDLIVFSPGDFDGDGSSDVMVVRDQQAAGALHLQPGNGRGGFTQTVRNLGYRWSAMRTVFGAGDFSGDHNNDVMAVNGVGDLYLYRGNGLGGFAGATQKIGQGWGGFLTVFSPGDFTGDGKSDVMAVSKDGSLYLFRGNGLGRFAAAGQKIGSGWGGFLSVFSPGDFSGDRRSDVMAVTPAGDLLQFRGNGRGGWGSSARKIGGGWDAFR
jgi:FG-GAP-like repeat